MADHWPMPDASHPPEAAGLLLPGLLDQAAARFAARPALRYEGRVWSYAGLADAVRAATVSLQQIGVGPGSRVGLCLPNTPYSVILYFAILRAGGVVVNFNPLYTAPELRALIAVAGVDLMVAPDLAAIFGKLASLLPELPALRLLVCPIRAVLPPLAALALPVARRGLLARPAWSARVLRYTPPSANATPRPVARSGTDLAVLQFTGGTTGLPKAAMLTHANLVVNAIQSLHLTPDLRPGEEKLLGILPLFHVYAMTSVMLAGIMLGAELQWHSRFVVDKLLDAIRRDRPTVMHAVPTIYGAILDHAARQGPARSVDLSSVRAFFSGGAPLPDDIRARFEQLVGQRLYEGYGLTEASPVLAFNPPEGEFRAGSVGQAVAWTTLEIRDLAPPHACLGPGQRGEICARGPQIMAGYLDRPEETRASFHDGALRTGDIGYLDQDGFLFITDRLKDVILCGGYNVYPRTIEEALYQHQAVTEAVVVGVPDSYRGEAPVAFVALKPGATATEADLCQHLRQLLSPIEQPKRILVRDSLPKTAVGKLSRLALRDAARADPACSA